MQVLGDPIDCGIWFGRDGKRMSFDANCARRTIHAMAGIAEGSASNDILSRKEFTVDFIDGYTMKVRDTTYSRACVQAAAARRDVGAMSHAALGVADGTTRPKHSRPPEKKARLNAKTRRMIAYPLLLMIDVCLWAIGMPWRRMRNESRGACAKCGQPVRHACPWWTGNPGRDGRPLHDECARKWGLFDE